LARTAHNHIPGITGGMHSHGYVPVVPAAELTVAALADRQSECDPD
jgi:hypothetical protein